MNQYAYQFIPAGMKKVYKDISLSLEKASNKVALPRSCSDRDVIEILCRCLLDIPEVFWLSSSIKTQVKTFTKEMTVSEIIPQSPSLSHMRNELESKTNDICSNQVLRSCRTDAEKLKYIYQYLQEHTVYDDEAAKNYDIHPFAHTAYGAIVMGKSVCDGNAKATALLCKKLNIPCIGVSGTLKGGGHSWTMVQCENIWYHMDATYRYYIGGNLEFSNWLQEDGIVQSADYRWAKDAYPACNHKNPYVSNKQQKSVISNFATHGKSKEDIPDDAIQIDNMSAYQRVIRDTFQSGNTQLHLIFTISFGPLREEMLIKLFERIATDSIASGISYQYIFQKEKRYLSIDWE